MKLLNFWLLYLPTFGTNDYNCGGNNYCSPTVHAGLFRFIKIQITLKLALKCFAVQTSVTE